jgi:AraC-like DNA-binding protein
VGFEQPRPDSWTEPPQPALTLMIAFGGSLRADGEGLPDAWVGGLSDVPAIVELDGGYSSLDLKLTPSGAYRIFGCPPAAMAGAVVTLEDVLGAEARRLVERLGGETDWVSRLDLIERFLLGRCAQGPDLSPAVQFAWDRLQASGGRVRIEALARELGCSRRYLSATFRTQIGLAPKSVARLLRFKWVCRRIDRAPSRWADIAFDAGYCDQSHLSRDFRELAGSTPSDFVARRMHALEALGDEIAFVQD